MAASEQRMPHPQWATLRSHHTLSSSHSRCSCHSSHRETLSMVHRSHLNTHMHEYTDTHNESVQYSRESYESYRREKGGKRAKTTVLAFCPSSWGWRKHRRRRHRAWLGISGREEMGLEIRKWWRRRGRRAMVQDMDEREGGSVWVLYHAERWCEL